MDRIVFMLQKIGAGFIGQLVLGHGIDFFVMMRVSVPKQDVTRAQQHSKLQLKFYRMSEWRYVYKSLHVK